VEHGYGCRYRVHPRTAYKKADYSCWRRSICWLHERTSRNHEWRQLAKSSINFNVGDMVY
jgi:hypothetical protein